MRPVGQGACQEYLRAGAASALGCGAAGVPHRHCPDELGPQSQRVDPALPWRRAQSESHAAAACRDRLAEAAGAV